MPPHSGHICIDITYLFHLIIVAIKEIFLGFVDVVGRNAVLVAAFRAAPYVMMIIESGLVVQICVTTVAPPVNVWKPLTHNAYPFFEILRSVPSLISLLTSRPEPLCLIYPGPSPSFFSNVPILQSLRVFLAMSFTFLVVAFAFAHSGCCRRFPKGMGFRISW